jgi:hypothetical protein
MKQALTILFVLAMLTGLYSQDVYKYAVHFTDKDNTPYSISQPEAYLSQKAIDRRAKYNIPVIKEDLPVDPAYIQQVLNATSDAKFIIEVKWHNAIVISLSDTNNIDLIDNLSSVEMTKLVFRPSGSKTSTKLDFEIEEAEVLAPMKSTSEYDSAFYGGAWTQIHQLKGEKLHELGFTGQGMTIAVLDAGFTNVDERLIFDRLWQNDQILGTANFVAPGQSVFADHSHGTSVLSTMGGYWEGNLVGTAPDADYWLIRTEDAPTEYLIEEYNWAAGAAFADSVGADVLNTSLGYTDFFDPAMDHTWEELNGDSTVITRAANMAYRKGMLVVNSAGNSGSSSWRYVGAPADGYQVLSVGAVDGDAEIWGSSSHGFPWSDDVKPDVVARGSGTYVASASFDAVGPGSGTSYSGPVIAGMSACLWQANPNLSPFMIKQAIYFSADKFNNPDTLYGYGLPNFEEALNILGINNQESSSKLLVAPNPTADQFELIIEDINSPLSWKLYNTRGQIMQTGIEERPDATIKFSLKDQPSGIYFLQLNQSGIVERVKISKI